MRWRRVAGKWQIPLFLFSTGLLGYALLRERPEAARATLEQRLSELDALVAGAHFDQAILLGEQLLLSPGLSRPDERRIHLQLARSRFERASRGGKSHVESGRRLVEHYRLAADGTRLEAADLERMGRAWEWQKQFSAAVDVYREAIAQGAAHPGELRRRLLSVMRDELALPAETLNELLDENLADPKVIQTEDRLWSIENKLCLLEEMDRLEEAEPLMERESPLFRDTPRLNDFTYLEALLRFKMGRFVEAEQLLRNLRNQLDTQDDLHAKSGWLLGQVILTQEAPSRAEESIAFFKDVLDRHPGHSYAPACRVGVGEALARLGRHEEAIQAFLAGIREMGARPMGGPVQPEILRAALSVLFQVRRAEGDLRLALAYVHAVSQITPGSPEQELALLQQLAQTQVHLAEQLRREEFVRGNETATSEPSAEVRELYASAAETHLRLSRLNVGEERVFADRRWQAAEFFVKADELEKAIELYSEFAAAQSSESFASRALLLVGQLRERQGRLGQAVHAYQELYNRFPRTLEATRALVPTAHCLEQMGPAHFLAAENHLRLVLEESEFVTPEAPEFCDALFLRGKLALKRGEPEMAVTILEEALERYPGDPRAGPARFQLGEAYRRSARELRRSLAESEAPAVRGNILQEMKGRLRAAASRYREVIDSYEAREFDDLTSMERTLLRHAQLYEADCQFEAQDYVGAVKLYEQLAGSMRDSVHALSVYVQIINCQVFLGRPAEARAALARALILVESLPESAFRAEVAPQSRKDWRQYFEWLDESELF